MKYRRRPVQRDVIDAVRLTLTYVYVDAQGSEQTLPHADFEALYEPIVRKRSGARPSPQRKARKPRKPRAEALPPTSEPPPDMFDQQRTPAGFMPI